MTMINLKNHTSQFEISRKGRFNYGIKANFSKQKILACYIGFADIIYGIVCKF